MKMVLFNYLSKIDKNSRDLGRWEQVTQNALHFNCWSGIEPTRASHSSDRGGPIRSFRAPTWFSKDLRDSICLWSVRHTSTPAPVSCIQYLIKSRYVRTNSLVLLISSLQLTCLRSFLYSTRAPTWLKFLRLHSLVFDSLVWHTFFRLHSLVWLISSLHSLVWLTFLRSFFHSTHLSDSFPHSTHFSDSLVWIISTICKSGGITVQAYKNV